MGTLVVILAVFCVGGTSPAEGPGEDRSAELAVANIKVDGLITLVREFLSTESELSDFIDAIRCVWAPAGGGRAGTLNRVWTYA